MATSKQDPQTPSERIADIVESISATREAQGFQSGSADTFSDSYREKQVMGQIEEDKPVTRFAGMAGEARLYEIASSTRFPNPEHALLNEMQDWPGLHEGIWDWSDTAEKIEKYGLGRTLGGKVPIVRDIISIADSKKFIDILDRLEAKEGSPKFGQEITIEEAEWLEIVAREMSYEPTLAMELGGSIVDSLSMGLDLASFGIAKRIAYGVIKGLAGSGGRLLSGGAKMAAGAKNVERAAKLLDRLKNSPGVRAVTSGASKTADIAKKAGAGDYGRIVSSGSAVVVGGVNQLRTAGEYLVYASTTGGLEAEFWRTSINGIGLAEDEDARQYIAVMDPQYGEDERWFRAAVNVSVTAAAERSGRDIDKFLGRMFKLPGKGGIIDNLPSGAKLRVWKAAMLNAGRRLKGAAEVTKAINSKLGVHSVFGEVLEERVEDFDKELIWYLTGRDSLMYQSPETGEMKELAFDFLIPEILGGDLSSEQLAMEFATIVGLKGTTAAMGLTAHGAISAIGTVRKIRQDPAAVEVRQELEEVFGGAKAENVAAAQLLKRKLAEVAPEIAEVLATGGVTAVNLDDLETAVRSDPELQKLAHQAGLTAALDGQWAPGVKEGADAFAAANGVEDSSRVRIRELGGGIGTLLNNFATTYGVRIVPVDIGEGATTAPMTYNPQVAPGYVFVDTRYIAGATSIATLVDKLYHEVDHDLRQRFPELQHVQEKLLREHSPEAVESMFEKYVRAVMASELGAKGQKVKAADIPQEDVDTQIEGYKADWGDDYQRRHVDEALSWARESTGSSAGSVSLLLSTRSGRKFLEAIWNDEGATGLNRLIDWFQERVLKTADGSGLTSNQRQKLRSLARELKGTRFDIRGLMASQPDFIKIAGLLTESIQQFPAEAEAGELTLPEMEFGAGTEAEVEVEAEAEAEVEVEGEGGLAPGPDGEEAVSEVEPEEEFGAGLDFDEDGTPLDEGGNRTMMTPFEVAHGGARGDKTYSPSLAKIGTGEGAAFFGWGLYGTDVFLSGIARRYASMFESNTGVVSQMPEEERERYGKNIQQFTGTIREILSSLTSFTEENGALFQAILGEKEGLDTLYDLTHSVPLGGALRSDPDSIDTLPASLRAAANDLAVRQAENAQSAKPDARLSADIIRAGARLHDLAREMDVFSWQAKDVAQRLGPLPESVSAHHVWQVEADPDSFFDWHDQLSNYPEALHAFEVAYGSDRTAPTFYADEDPDLADRPLGELTGEEAYKVLAKHLAGPTGVLDESYQKTSEALRDAGLPGHKFLSNTVYGDAKEGEYNWVFYRDDILKPLTQFIPSSGMTEKWPHYTNPGTQATPLVTAIETVVQNPKWQAQVPKLGMRWDKMRALLTGFKIKPTKTTPGGRVSERDIGYSSLDALFASDDLVTVADIEDAKDNYGLELVLEDAFDRDTTGQHIPHTSRLALLAGKEMLAEGPPRVLVARYKDPNSRTPGPLDTEGGLMDVHYGPHDVASAIYNIVERGGTRFMLVQELQGDWAAILHAGYAELAQRRASGYDLGPLSETDAFEQSLAEGDMPWKEDHQWVAVMLSGLMDIAAKEGVSEVRVLTGEEISRRWPNMDRDKAIALYDRTIQKMILNLTDRARVLANETLPEGEKIKPDQGGPKISLGMVSGKLDIVRATEQAATDIVNSAGFDAEALLADSGGDRSYLKDIAERILAGHSDPLNEGRLTAFDLHVDHEFQLGDMGAEVRDRGRQFHEAADLTHDGFVEFLQGLELDEEVLARLDSWFEWQGPELVDDFLEEGGGPPGQVIEVIKEPLLGPKAAVHGGEVWKERKGVRLPAGTPAEMRADRYWSLLDRVVPPQQHGGAPHPFVLLAAAVNPGAFTYGDFANKVADIYRTWMLSEGYPSEDALSAAALIRNDIAQAPSDSSYRAQFSRVHMLLKEEATDAGPHERLLRDSYSARPGSRFTSEGEHETDLAIPAYQYLSVPISPEVRQTLPHLDTFLTPLSSSDIGLPAPGIAAATISSLGSLLRRNFTALGGLPLEAWVAKIKAKAEFDGLLVRAGFIQKDLSRAMKKEWGKVTPEQRQLLNDYLAAPLEEDLMRLGPQDAVALAGTKERLAEQIPTDIFLPLNQMRMMLDTLSRRIVGAGIPSGGTQKVIVENDGMYLHRSYRLFDDPFWHKKVPADVRATARDWLTRELSGQGKSQDQIDGVLEALLFREGSAVDRDLRQPGSLFDALSKLDSKDLSILKRRKNIPPEIRALWGEYNDPMVNYLKSVEKMGQLLQSNEFLTNMRDAGIKGGWLNDAETGPTASGNLISKIASDESDVLSPLNGMYGSPGLVRALNDTYKQKVITPWLRWYLKANGLVKFNKTVLSAMTQVRNFWGNVGFAVASGHWNAMSMGPAMRDSARSLLGLDSDLEFREKMIELTELGVLGQGARGAELREYMEEAYGSSFMQFADNWLARSLKGGMDAAQRLYMAGDDVWKMYAYTNEYDRLRDAYSKSERTDQEVKLEAAEIIANTYPTYNRVPKAIQMLRRFPLTGTFTSFAWEVYRTGFHGLRLAAQHIGSDNEKIRAIGYKRLLGMAMAGGAAQVISKSTRMMFGYDDEDDKLIRRFMAPWEQHHDFGYMPRGEDGHPIVIDLSYTNPYSYLTGPINAFISGDDWEESLLNSSWEIFEPYLGEEILAKALREVVSNRKDSGAPVYLPVDEGMTKFTKGIEHLWKAGEPGAIRQAYNIYKAQTGVVEAWGGQREPATEIAAVTLGLRMKKMNIPQAMSWKATRHMDNKQWATSILTKAVETPGELSDDALVAAYRKMENLHHRQFLEIQADIHAALRFGYSKEEIRGAMSPALGQRASWALTEGRYDAFMWRLTTQWTGGLMQRALGMKTTDPEGSVELRAKYMHRIKTVANLMLERFREINPR